MATTPATVQIRLDVPARLADLAFPEPLDQRLHVLLDKQGRSEPLGKAEALVDMAELMTLLRLRISPQEQPVRA